ncbi:hypothetical protein [Microbacterium mangrovi]|uniref:hypothetical protein n=1 Tax=Microbacterium mangrovi TaxID=1348253 RepID=UPI0012E0161F|nr:hypothetical protein [Microbacterium mangrovi]
MGLMSKNRRTPANRRGPMISALAWVASGAIVFAFQVLSGVALATAVVTGFSIAAVGFLVNSWYTRDRGRHPQR